MIFNVQVSKVVTSYFLLNIKLPKQLECLKDEVKMCRIDMEIKDSQILRVATMIEEKNCEIYQLKKDLDEVQNEHEKTQDALAITQILSPRTPSQLATELTVEDPRLIAQVLDTLNESARCKADKNNNSRTYCSPEGFAKSMVEGRETEKLHHKDKKISGLLVS